VCAAFIGLGISPATFAATPTETTKPISYETALEAYEAGDYATALIHGKVAGSGGNADAQVMVGHILMQGENGLVDRLDAAKWFLKAAKQGHTDAMVALGELGLTNSGGLSHSDAVNWLTKAADRGRTDAMRALADTYLHGKGTPPDREKAREWLIKAANFGDAFAERSLGDLHFETNAPLALEWYEKAASHGDNDAAYIAAIMYAENFDIRPNAKRAAELLAQAANAGIAPAQADYGLLVYQGNGVERSAEQAAQWFQKSAKGGDPEGRFLYAFTLAKGDGIAKSFEEAYYWLLRAEQETGNTGVDDYDKDRAELRKRLEANVDAAILQKARTRAASDRLTSIGGAK
jgi:TPR repeat protein